MSNKQSKKWRRWYFRNLDASSHMALKKEVLRLARNRDILGIVCVIENIALGIILLYLHFR